MYYNEELIVEKFKCENKKLIRNFVGEQWTSTTGR